MTGRPGSPPRCATGAGAAAPTPASRVTPTHRRYSASASAAGRGLTERRLSDGTPRPTRGFIRLGLDTSRTQPNCWRGPGAGCHRPARQRLGTGWRRPARTGDTSATSDRSGSGTRSLNGVMTRRPFRRSNVMRLPSSTASALYMYIEPDAPTLTGLPNRTMDFDRFLLERRVSSLPATT